MAQIPTTYCEKTMVWSGATGCSIYNPNTSVGMIIFNNMKTWPKNVCQINDIDGVTVTYEQAVAWAIRIAQYLKQRGLNHKDVIGIAARNTNYVMPLAVACLMNTTPFHAVNPTLNEATIKHLFSITKPSLIFCDGPEYQKVYAATLEWRPDIYTLSDPIEGVPKIESLLDPTTSEKTYMPQTLQNGGDQTVAILCSSGTTGLAKAVCISNDNFIQGNFHLNSESVFFSSSSLDWISGLLAFVCNTISGLTRIITNKPFEPKYFVHLVKKYKINYTVIPPEHMSTLINSPDATTEAMASITNMNYGGGLISLSSLKKAQQIFKNAVLNAIYGMTEVGAIAINLGINNTACTGKLLPGFRARIVDENGKNLTYNQVGEIYLHTGRSWNGYFGNPEETQSMQDSDGWFHTGDLGYFDEQNFLYIVDRKKDLLKYHGLHYGPVEIEKVIAELPQVQNVCVVGIYDESVGDKAGALVVKSTGTSISAKEIVDHVAKRLPGIQKQLHAGVCFTDKLPANNNGKIMRKEARENFMSQMMK